MFVPRALIVSAGFLLAGLFGLGAYFLPLLQVATPSVRSTSLPDLDPRLRSSAPFTVLLLGSDDDAKFPPDRLNTQSMILVRVDPGAKQATMLSIPRDLWVPIPNQGEGKISTAFQLGGAPAAIAAVDQFRRPCRPLRLDWIERAGEAGRPAWGRQRHRDQPRHG